MRFSSQCTSDCSVVSSQGTTHKPRMLVNKSPSGCPWFILNCRVIAGPSLCHVAIKIRALSSNPRSAHTYKNCAHSHGRSMHAGTYPIRDTPFVSKIPCRNILSLVRACAIGWGGQRNGSLAKGLPATRDRNSMGLMSLSSSCARSVDLVTHTAYGSSLLCGLLDLCGLCGLIAGTIVPWTMSEARSLLNLFRCL